MAFRIIEEKKPGKGFRIRYHILMSYLFLVGLSLALLWGTQILFLNRFYENERIGIAEKTADTMSEYFNQYDEEQMKSSISVDNVVRIKNSGGKYTVSGKTGCNSYLDVNGDPVLILEVNHALGDYVEVQF